MIYVIRFLSSIRLLLHTFPIAHPFEEYAPYERDLIDLTAPLIPYPHRCCLGTFGV